MKYSRIFLLLFLVTVIILAATGCATGQPDGASEQPGGIADQPGSITGQPGSGTVQAADLMNYISANPVSGKPADVSFAGSMADFSIELFKNSISDNKNSLVSPLSVMLALSMTANGADGETLAQMEQLLGNGIPLTELNEYLYSYIRRLPSEEKAKLSIANSIWLRDDEGLQVNPGFLQTNADYYNAAVYKSAFGDETLKEINDWVNKNTDGLIDKILEDIDDDAMLYLINAIVFDAEWQKAYSIHEVRENTFTDINGKKQLAPFMHSEELLYLDDGRATGFIKPYINNDYSFIALLPNEDISIGDYISTLSGSGFVEMIQNAEFIDVYASMPKFSYEYEVSMNDTLKNLGMPDAFQKDTADFNKMAISDRGNLYIFEVLHKTFISVDELGTKAGAVTSVEVRAESAPLETRVVNLDRPFVYAIIDNTTGLPIFIGTLMVT